MKRKQNVDYAALDYRRSVRSSIHSLWNRTLDLFGFLENMNLTIRRGYTLAWNRGMASCGILPADMTEEERNRLADEINGQFQFILGFGDDIIQHRDRGGGINAMYNRAEMWAGRYEAVQSLARTYACADQKLIWIMGATREHCMSCIKLDGRVYRASTWKKYNIYARSPDLECGGHKCQCRLEPTDLPVTPGRPPGLP